jgi:protein-disulfide isomerase
MEEEQSNKTIYKGRPNYLTPMAIVMAGVLISIGLVVKDNPQIFGSKFAKETEKSATGAQVAQPTAQPKPLKPFYLDVEEAGGPTLGDASAPVTIIEISDYECPYCKMHAIQGAGPQIEEKYIKTGKARLIFRDFPLSFHNPAATTDAEIAECVRAQGGDSAYFKFHKLLFENTKGNGGGIEDSTMYQLATQAGVNSALVKTCYSNGTKKQAVQDDINQISEYGTALENELQNRVSKGEEDSRWVGKFGLGTPAFFIGKTSPNGKIKGEFVSGARPFSDFATIIEKYLK